VFKPEIDVVLEAARNQLKLQRQRAPLAAVASTAL
jgi:hypothetical protein